MTTSTSQRILHALEADGSVTGLTRKGHYIAQVMIADTFVGIGVHPNPCTAREIAAQKVLAKIRLTDTELASTIQHLENSPDDQRLRRKTTRESYSYGVLKFENALEYLQASYGSDDELN
jgi:hypothetical protein